VKLFKRHILTIIALVLYWPGIFILTHIPVPKSSLFVVHVSDKTLHFLAYFVLVFLLWFAINPNAKVSWRKPAAWWILFVVVWYGVFDEWLQGYVGRDPDVIDFLADLSGSVTALILLSVLNFWTASLIVTGGTIFLFTNFAQATPAEWIGLPAPVFYFLSYTFFSVLWIRWIHHFVTAKIPEPKWLIVAFGIPLLFLTLTNLFSLIVVGNGKILSMIFSAVGIIAVALTSYLGACYGQRSNRGHVNGTGMIF
jgi:VanZ family protein